MSEKLLTRLSFIEDRLDEDLAKCEENKLLMEHNSIINYFESGRKKYKKALDFCKKKGFLKAYDIGCAYGFQSELFITYNIDYVGIDCSVKNDEFWDSGRFIHLNKTYPFKIKADKQNDVAISILCLCWNCYLTDGEETLRTQMEQLSKDFNHVILYIDNRFFNIVKSYFKGYESFDSLFYYFYN